jgi:hypothetical protein
MQPAAVFSQSASPLLYQMICLVKIEIPCACVQQNKNEYKDYMFEHC